MGWYLIPAALPISFLIAAVVYINEFPDLEADAIASKKTLIVRMRRARAVYGYCSIMGLAYLTLLVNVLTKIMPIWCLIAFLTLPITLKASITLKTHFDNTPKLMVANASTVAVHFIFSILLCVGYLLAGLSKK